MTGKIPAPVTGYVRESYAREKHPDSEELIELRRQGFDRWLSTHEAGVRAEAIRHVLDGTVLSSGFRGIAVWDSRDHYDTGRPDPLPIREWLARAANRAEETPNQEIGGQK